MKPDLKMTLELLMLHKPNHCVVMDPSPQTMGMILRVNEYIAFGPISTEILQKLIEKRGEKGEGEVDVKSVMAGLSAGKKMKELIDPVFRLHPPRGGYKNIKKPFPLGDLGKRTDMDTLLKRMM
jgi:large subunit ribosomal protein L30